MLSPQEIHYYNNLVESEKVHNVIFCPMGREDIIVMKLDEDDMIYFYCITCKTTFKLTKDMENIIKSTVQLFISKNTTL